MISAAVIGLGRIGSRNDAARNERPLSHVGAILATEEIELAAMVDVDACARESAAELWRHRTDAALLPSMADIAPGSLDVITICTPTSRHADDVAVAIALKPRVVIVEKPLAADLAGARTIVSLAEAAAVPVIVNFNRRFDTATQAFAGRFPGLPQKVILRYGKGLSNYASHMIDLLLHWFGDIEAVQAVPHQWDETSNPTIDFRCRFDSGFDAIFCGIENIDYDLFDIELYFSDRRMGYLNGGAERREWHPVDSLHYAGYAHLSERRDLLASGQIGGFHELYRAAAKYLSDGGPLPGCKAREAMRVQMVIDAVRQSGAQGGRVIELKQSA
jgi:UDP-N-acetyl-2-amino-2-deoxyglucuronate dehydrogenase